MYTRLISLTLACRWVCRGDFPSRAGIPSETSPPSGRLRYCQATSKNKRFLAPWRALDKTRIRSCSSAPHLGTCLPFPLGATQRHLPDACTQPLLQVGDPFVLSDDPEARWNLFDLVLRSSTSHMPKSSNTTEMRVLQVLSNILI